MAEQQFNEQRWRRAGASDDEIAKLEARFDAMSVSDQQGEDAWLAGVSDDDLREYLDATREAGFDTILPTDETSDEAHPDEVTAPDDGVDPAQPAEKRAGRHTTATRATGTHPTEGADSGST